MKLTDPEQRLLSNVIAGTLTDLAPNTIDMVVDAEMMRLWDGTHEVRGAVLTEILRGRYLPASAPAPRAIRLRGASIAGRLDLDGISTTIRLELTSCYLPAGINGYECVLPRLVLDRSVISSSGGDSEDGAVHLVGSHITGGLSMTDATVANPTGPAIRADSMIVDGDVYLDGSFEATGAGERGVVQLPAARIAGELFMTGASLRNEVGPAFYANRLTVGNSAFLDGAFEAHGSGTVGAVVLTGAQITGQLVMTGGTIINETGPAISADDLHVVGDAIFDGSFTARGDGELGAIRFVGAQVTGQLNMRDATLTNGNGPALHADGALVDGDAIFDGMFRAYGRSSLGAVCLPGARVGGQLLMSDAIVASPTGPALSADGVIVAGDVFLDDNFQANGHGERGAVCLDAARIGGQFVMSNATVSSDDGVALDAYGAIVEGDVFLDGSFEASGNGVTGVVRIDGAHISGRLVMTDAKLRNRAGPALQADRLTVGGDVAFTGTFCADGGGELGAVRLRSAHIGGLLSVNQSSMDRARNGARWNVDGLTYEHYPNVGFDGWLTLLKAGTLAYRPQPYRQLAAAAVSAGHDGDARRALMAQRDDQVARGDLSTRAKAWAHITKLTLGYGYQPWRALVGVALVLFIAIAAFSIPGALQHSSFPHPHASPVVSSCTMSEVLQISVDVAIPLISTSAGTSCGVTSSPQGQFVSALSVFLALAGWALTALFAAGFTKAVRAP